MNAWARTLTVVAIFCVSSSALYGSLYAYPSQPVELFYSYAPLMAVILWLERDAARTRVASVHDFGLLLWFTWWFVIPWYAWRTRGAAGWRLIAVLFAIVWSASWSWAAGAWLGYGVRYAVWYLTGGSYVE